MTPPLHIPICIALAPLAAAHDPAAASARVERHVALMGTVLEIDVTAESREAALLASEACLEALEATENRLSTWRPDTELAELNRAPVGEFHPLSAELAEDLAEVRPWWSATRGAFDPCVGALVQAWGLRAGGRTPDAQAIARAIVPDGYAMLALERGGVIRLHSSVIIDEGGFGKGVGLERALAALRRARATSATLDLGGQIALFGTVPHRVAVADPRDRARPVLEFWMDGGSVATSSNSERGLTIDGARIGHLLDPRTGRPAADFGSITVWSTSATAADCLSTGLFVLGPDDALNFARNHPEVRVLVLEIGHDGLVARTSANFAMRLVPLVSDVHLRATPEAQMDAPSIGPSAPVPQRANPLRSPTSTH